MRKLWIRRKAVSNLIGGIIVLTLFLSAITAMIVLTQEYDAFQGTSSKMAQKDIDRFSENLKAMYPGLTGGFPATGCGSQCNQYNMYLANIGNIPVQIARIYINSTQQTTGCTNTNNNVKGPCVFNPGKTIASFNFNSTDSYIAPGELSHIVRLWLPNNIVLPNASLTPSNSIWVVTNRGRVFSFEWPFPPVGQGLPGQGVPPTIFRGEMKVAYTGTPDSQPGALPQHDSNHQETGFTYRRTLPIGGGKFLYFVNPWITTSGGTVPQHPRPDRCLHSLRLRVLSELFERRVNVQLGIHGDHGV